MNSNTEENILIAEFIGMQKTDLGWFDNEEVLQNTDGDNTFDKLLFDTDWNWLMAVIDKTEEMCYKSPDNYVNVTIGASKYCKIVTNDGDGFTFIGEDETKIDSVFYAVCGFVNFYNENKQDFI